MPDERAKARILRGFQDLLPPRARLRQRIVEVFREVLALYGFAPLETPALEREEILLSDMGVDANKQIYRFSDLENTSIGLRYDFTVSLARTVAANLNQLQLPFKRYQVGPVWRFDKPKAGRYREFVQLDADIVGAAPWEPEVEILVAFAQALSRLELNRFVFRLNDRHYLSQKLEALGVDRQREKDVFRVLDKLRRQGEKKVRAELTGKLLLQDFDSALEYERMQEVAIPEEAADGLLNALNDREGLGALLRPLLGRAIEDGVPPESLVADPSLTRGLDYYTGFVCEIELAGAESLGSVGGGGRYDNLLERYGTASITGVGMSVGVDRLLDAMELLGLDGGVPAAQSTAQVLVTVFDDSLVSQSARIARLLREAGVPSEMWLPSGNRSGRTLSRQFKYADKVGIPLAVVAGEDELAAEPPVVQLKDLRTEFGQEGKQVAVPLAELAGRVRELLEA